MSEKRTTLAFIHLQVLLLVAGKETVEYDFRQRALEELAELGLVEKVHATRPFAASDQPRLRAELTVKGSMAVADLLRALARRARK